MPHLRTVRSTSRVDVGRRVLLYPVSSGGPAIVSDQMRSLRAIPSGEDHDDEFIQGMRNIGIEFLDIRFVDLPGRWHHVTIPTEAVAASLFRLGVGFDGSSAGFKSVESGDMVLIPDRSTVAVEDVDGRAVASLLGTAAEADTRRPFSLDPRVIARRSEEALRAAGHADESIWSPELEFYVFSGVSYDNGRSGAFYEVESIDAGWVDPESPEAARGYRIQPGAGYDAAPPSDVHFALRNEIAHRMQSLGIPVKYHHHENGAPGQMEIELLGEPLMDSADHLMHGKHVVRTTADDWGTTATFMPHPVATEAGNGLHFHIKLRRGGEPVFHGEESYAGLSETALYFIGGILTHGRALSAITNPSTNSYRRLRPGYEAPTNLFFSAANRSAAIRIPRYATEPDTKTIEYRPPDASGNPYLTMAALLAAGLDGIERSIDPRENGFGPFDTNIHGLPREERDRIVPLPATLEEALDELRADSDFLTANDVFPRDFVRVWTTLKMNEIEHVRTQPHPKEYDLYYDC